MNAIIRVASLVGKTSAGNPEKCCDSILQQLSALQDTSVDVAVLPAMALLPPSCGSLAKNPLMLELVREGLGRISEATAKLSAYVFVGLPVELGGRILSVTAAFHSGELIGLVLTPEDTVLLGEAVTAPFLPADTVFTCGEARIKVLGGTVTELYSHMELARDCDCLVLPSYAPAKAGDFSAVRSAVCSLSSAMGAAVVCVNGGVGDTSSPNCYRGYVITGEDGCLLCAECSDSVPICSIYDIDLQIARGGKLHAIMPASKCFHAPTCEKTNLCRDFSTMPYLPQDGSAYLTDLFALQAQSLATRLRNTGIQKVVLGVSGGLDSTLALLVASRAMDELSLPRTNILAVTMPGFGTGGRTYKNAVALTSLMNASPVEISIKASVSQHLADISHPEDCHNVTYENAQARERTQILLDLGNKHGAVVVGTGDLTEIALGWCTFGGDQFAGYNVNSSVPKTLVRRLVKLISTQCGEELSSLLLDILATPISPELLPLADGELSQLSEDILGAYEIHDFFLYYFVKYSFTPEKLLAYACAAFDGVYSPQRIQAQLKVFLQRFVSAQFKRSPAPDSAAITDWGISPQSFSMPSDMSSEAFLYAIDRLA